MTVNYRDRWLNSWLWNKNSPYVGDFRILKYVKCRNPNRHQLSHIKQTRLETGPRRQRLHLAEGNLSNDEWGAKPVGFSYILVITNQLKTKTIQRTVRIGWTGGLTSEIRDHIEILDGRTFQETLLCNYSHVVSLQSSFAAFLLRLLIFPFNWSLRFNSKRNICLE